MEQPAGNKITGNPSSHPALSVKWVEDFPDILSIATKPINCVSHQKRSGDRSHHRNGRLQGNPDITPIDGKERQRHCNHRMRDHRLARLSHPRLHAGCRTHLYLDGRIETGNSDPGTLQDKRLSLAPDGKSGMAPAKQGVPNAERQRQHDPPAGGNTTRWKRHGNWPLSASNIMSC